MPRSSSGLVKKGKFVRALLEAMAKYPDRTTKEYFLRYNQAIGPSLDYVQTNLDKLVASGEVLKDKTETLTVYKLAGDMVMALPPKDVFRLEDEQGELKAIVHRAPKRIPAISAKRIQEIASIPDSQIDTSDIPELRLVVGNSPQPIITKEVFVPIKGKLPRNEATEQILSTYWLQMGSGGVFDDALSHYEAIHKAKSQVTPFKGKLGGDRLTFVDSTEKE